MVWNTFCADTCFFEASITKFITFYFKYNDNNDDNNNINIIINK